jgi:hypothetical protein
LALQVRKAGKKGGKLMLLQGDGDDGCMSM